jgi:defect-in-organelle-trafficking protein DotC
MMMHKILLSAVAVLLMSGSGIPIPPAWAQSMDNDKAEGVESQLTPPPKKEDLLYLEVDEDDDPIKEGGLDIREDAMKEAALSYGARGGLAWRTYQIRQELEGSARYMDKVFNFRQLLISAPSGFLIEPPIITEAENNMIVEGGGLQAAVTDRMFNINTNVKIVTAPKTWRQYLEREWGEVEPPPNILRPTNREERAIWIKQVERGWKEGVQQADEIFESDLNLLVAHFRGMVRYRILLAQEMVTPTLAVQTDRGITGGGNQMRIGDRAVQIVDIPQLVPESEEWQPANR